MRVYGFYYPLKNSWTYLETYVIVAELQAF